MVVQLGAAQLIDGHFAFDGERALHEALLIHLTRQERHAERLLRDAERDAQRERRLAAADVAAQQDQVAPPHPAAEHLVERAEAGGDGVAGDLAGTLRVDTLDERVERGAFFEAAGWRRHGL